MRYVENRCNKQLSPLVNHVSETETEQNASKLRFTVYIQNVTSRATNNKQILIHKIFDYNAFFAIDFFFSFCLIVHSVLHCYNMSDNDQVHYYQYRYL